MSRGGPRGRGRRAAALISAIAILLIVAAFSALCLSVFAAQISIEQAGVQRLRAEAAAMAGTHLALWQIGNDSDLANCLARSVAEDDTSFDTTPLITVDGELLGAAFTVDVWPGEDMARVRSQASAGAVSYVRWTQIPLVLGGAQFETGTVTGSSKRKTVKLINTYNRPVVVCSARYHSNKTPIVARVSNVGSESFDVRLVNPSGGKVSGDHISYIVMEEGAWTIEGVNCEAYTYTSNRTDSSASWVGEQRVYENAYANPVVIGQVMTENDADWSVFWCHNRSRKPPTRTALWTGKTVCEDPDRTRAAETVGYIVFEAGHGSIAGVEFEALLGPTAIQGAGDKPPYAYSFADKFDQKPNIAVVSLGGMRGGNGGWAQTHGTTAATTTNLYLSIDEDQVRDKERNHVAEQVGCVVFESSVAYPSASKLVKTPRIDPPATVSPIP